MPSRIIMVAIIAFWVATTTWLFQRDVWPRVYSEDPPPFALDVVDEAPRPRNRHETHWRVTENDLPVGSAKTIVTYDQSEHQFDIAGRVFLSSRPPRSGLLPPLDHQREMAESLDKTPVTIKNTYKVTPEGELKMLTTDVLTSSSQDSPVPVESEVELTIEGKVENQVFDAHWWLRKPKDGGPAVQLDLVRVSKDGCVLNTMHPPPRVPGLFVGKRWRVPAIDPLAAARTPLQRPELVLLDARVGEEMLELGRREVECFVIHYSGRDTALKTWVRQSDGLVLQHQVEFGGHRLVMRRYAR
jgi:hypothetical protein